MSDGPKTNGNGRGSDGRFQPGNKFGPGRPRGSKHRLAETLLFELADDFDQHGRDAIIACREQNPANYLRIISACIPKEMLIETSNPLDDYTTEELDIAIRKLLDEIREQSDAEGEDDEAKAADGLH